MEWVVGIAVFVVLLALFPVVVLGLLALAAAGGALIGLWYWIESVNTDRQIKRIIVEVSYDDKQACTQAHPVAVHLINKNSRTVVETRFDIRAHRPGYSKSVLSKYLTTDRIINPMAML